MENSETEPSTSQSGLASNYPSKTIVDNAFKNTRLSKLNYFLFGKNKSLIILFIVVVLLFPLVYYLLFSPKSIRTASAQVFAEEMTNIYNNFSTLLEENIYDIFNTRSKLSISLTETIKTSQNLSFPLYEDVENNEALPTPTYEAISEKLNQTVSDLSLQITSIESTNIHPNGEKLKHDLTLYLTELQKLAISIKDFSSVRADVFVIIDSDLPGEISGLMNKDVLTSEDIGKIIYIVRSSEESAEKLGKYTPPSDDVSFISDYYKNISEMINRSFMEINKNIILNRFDLAKENLNNLHTEYYKMYSEFSLETIGYIHTTYLEEGFAESVAQTEINFLDSLGNFIKNNNLSMSVPESKMADLLSENFKEKPDEKNPASNVNKKFKERFYVGKGTTLLNFLMNTDQADKFKFTVSDPNGKTFDENSGHREQEARFENERTYQMWQIKQPAIVEGFWTMEAEGPENIIPTLTANDRGSSVVVQLDVFQKESGINKPFILAAMVMDGKPVQNATVKVHADDHYISDISGMDDYVLLEPVGNIDEIRSALESMGYDNEIGGLYVGTFKQTQNYGTYCFTAIFEWPHSSGEIIRRQKSSGCEVISPEK